MGWSVLHSDDFNRSNRSLSSDTMSDNTGAWSIGCGSYSIVSNTAQGGSYSMAYDNVMSAVDKQKVSAKFSSASGMIFGVVARYDGSSYFYFADFGYFGSGQRLFYANTAGSVFTSLGNGGTSGVTNDVITLETDGSTLTVHKNGSSVFSVTDSNIATGVSGMFDYNFLGGQTLDDWQVETYTADTVTFSFIGFNL